MLLLEIQVGVIPKLLIYVLNLCNALINSYYSRKTAELLMKSRLLMSNRVFLEGDFNLHHIDWDV